MARKAYHLNLLMESERLSSSPVRFRVMLPILAALAALGMAVWWLILLGQLMLAQSSESRLKGEIAARDAAHRSVREQMAKTAELEARLSQLNCYSNSIVRRGELLTKIAEAMPLKVQLAKLEIPPPEPPKKPVPPKPKKGKKAPPVFGPTGYVERASLVLAGRATNAASIQSLMEALAGDSFTNDVVVTRDSPRVRVRQDVTRTHGAPRMDAFDIECLLSERRFDK